MAIEKAKIDYEKAQSLLHSSGGVAIGVDARPLTVEIDDNEFTSLPVLQRLHVRVSSVVCTGLSVKNTIEVSLPISFSRMELNSGISEIHYRPTITEDIKFCAYWICRHDKLFDLTIFKWNSSISIHPKDPSRSKWYHTLYFDLCLT